MWSHETRELQCRTALFACLMWPENRPLRPVAADVRDWIIEETRANVRAVDRNYPKLGLRRLLAEADLVIGPGQDDGRRVKAATP